MPVKPWPSGALRFFAVRVFSSGLSAGRALLLSAGAHNAGVDRLQREDQQVDQSCPEGRPDTSEGGYGNRDQPDQDIQEEALHLLARHRQLLRVELQGGAQRVGPQVHQKEHELDGDEACTVDDQQERYLGSLYHLTVAETQPLVYQHGEEKLQWVDVQEHEEEQRRVQPPGRSVLQAVASEELVVVVPHGEEQREADREREETPHGREQLVEGLGDLQGHHQERYREGEDGVGEPFDARDILPAPAEVLLAALPPRQPFAHHYPFTPARPPPVCRVPMIEELSQYAQSCILTGDDLLARGDPTRTSSRATNHQGRSRPWDPE